jgi:Predicted membrane protein (DUF2232)
LGPAAVASLAATVLTLVTSGIVGALVFVAIEVAPVLFLLRQALQWRTDESGAVEWYPPGRLITDLSLAAMAAALLFLMWLGTGAGGIMGVFDRFVEAFPSDLPSDGPIAQAHALMMRWAHWLPGIVTASWVLMTVLNAMLAQMLAVRSGLARRPTPDIVSVQIPSWCVLPLAAAVPIVIFATGWLTFAGIVVLMLLSIPYLFQGLAVLHALSRRHAPSRVPIVGFYVLLVVFSWPLVLLVVLLGLAEEWTGLRRRFA